MVLLEARVGVKYVVADEIQICCCGSNTNMLHLKMSNTLSFKNSNTNTLDQIKICSIKISNTQTSQELNSNTVYQNHQYHLILYTVLFN